MSAVFLKNKIVFFFEKEKIEEKEKKYNMPAAHTHNAIEIIIW